LALAIPPPDGPGGTSQPRRHPISAVKTIAGRIKFLT
jgi:hypothetical protein